MGNTNGIPRHRATVETTRLPKPPSLRRYTLPFEVSVHDMSGDISASPSYLQIVAARLMLEETDTWQPYLDAAFRASGAVRPDLYNLEIRLLTDDDAKMAGVLSWIGPSALHAVLRRNLDWFLNDRMAQYGLQSEPEGWWASVTAGTLRIAYPRLMDFPLRPVSDSGEVTPELRGEITAMAQIQAN